MFTKSLQYILGLTAWLFSLGKDIPLIRAQCSHTSLTVQPVSILATLRFNPLLYYRTCFINASRIIDALTINPGLAFRFVFYVLTKIMLRKYREIAPVLWVIFALSVLHLLLHTLEISAHPSQIVSTFPIDRIRRNTILGIHNVRSSVWAGKRKERIFEIGGGKDEGKHN